MVAVGAAAAALTPKPTPAQWTAGASLNRATTSMTDIECVWTRARLRLVNISFDMCTYPSRLDRHISLAIQKAGCLECDEVNWMVQLLQESRSKTVAPLLVDAGANIGCAEAQYIFHAGRISLSVVHCSIPDACVCNTACFPLQQQQQARRSSRSSPCQPTQCGCSPRLVEMACRLRCN